MANPQNVQRDAYVLYFDHDGSQEADKTRGTLYREIQELLSKKLRKDDRFLDYDLGYDYTEDVTEDYKEFE